MTEGRREIDRSELVKESAMIAQKARVVLSAIPLLPSLLITAMIFLSL
jgi:hypothetical protein